MTAALGENQEGGDFTAVVQQAVEFNRSFAFAECGPGKEGKTQVNGGGV